MTFFQQIFLKLLMYRNLLRLVAFAASRVGDVWWRFGTDATFSTVSDTFLGSRRGPKLNRNIFFFFISFSLSMTKYQSTPKCCRGFGNGCRAGRQLSDLFWSVAFKLSSFSNSTESRLTKEQPKRIPISIPWSTCVHAFNTNWGCLIVRRNSNSICPGIQCAPMGS